MKKNEIFRITLIDRPKNNIQKIFVLDNQNEVMLADDYFCIISNYRLFKIELLTRDCIISNVVLRHVSDMVLFTTRKFGWTVNSSRSCSNNDSDHVSLIGRHLALLPSRLKSQGGVLTKPEKLIGLIFAHQ